MKKYRPVSLKSVKTYSLCNRHSKVSLKTFAGIPERGDSLSAFLDKLPESFAVKDFKAVVKAVVQARKQDRPVVLGMGAHPVKLGLSPLIIELIKKKIVTAIATNGACAIHDFEMALAGHTSEDVGPELCSGTFGMSKDTGKGVNLAINRGVKKGFGIGRAIGECISKGKFI